jgi:hypothetical protein
VEIRATMTLVDIWKIPQSALAAVPLRAHATMAIAEQGTHAIMVSIVMNTLVGLVPHVQSPVEGRVMLPAAIPHPAHPMGAMAIVLQDVLYQKTQIAVALLLMDVVE